MRCHISSSPSSCRLWTNSTSSYPVFRRCPSGLYLARHGACPLPMNFRGWERHRRPSSRDGRHSDQVKDSTFRLRQSPLLSCARRSTSRIRLNQVVQGHAELVNFLYIASSHEASASLAAPNRSFLQILAESFELLRRRCLVCLVV